MLIKEIRQRTKVVIKDQIQSRFIGQIYRSMQDRKAYSQKNININKTIYNLKGKENQLRKTLYEMGKDVLCEEDFFYYNIKKNLIVAHNKRVICNLAISYEKVIGNGLRQLIRYSEANEMVQNNNRLLIDVIQFVESLAEQLMRKKSEMAERHAKNLRKMLNAPADSLEDAFQRILIWNSFLWQTQHNLLGFGRLDKILEPYYERGKEKGEDSYRIIKEFIYTIHKYDDYKSAAMRGDTGQVIILGGLNEDGSYFVNDLSYFFLRIARELHLPDPKFIVRVSKKMPHSFLKEAVLTIASGIGNPLLSNDDVIVPYLREFYQDNEIACNYVTTACWSPVAFGNSISQCNVCVRNFIHPLWKALQSRNSFSNFDNFFACYLRYLNEDWSNGIENANQVSWEEDPLLSFLVEGCIEKEKDISTGGARHNDYGIQTIGLPNAVNSLYNIKKYCFEEKKYSLSEIKEILDKNYDNEQKLMEQLLNSSIRFGCDNDDILDISNRIIDTVAELLVNKKNCYGEKYKFGLSSPSFITQGKESMASFDGRKVGEPLGVQITPDIGISVTELARFASKLHYSDWCSNGNVMDLMFTQNMIDKHIDKIEFYIRGCIELGIFQMQFNILSYHKLLDAKAHPEKYKNLIVRVWGFNAYFNDLPEEYQDLMIERAKKLEGTI